MKYCDCSFSPLGRNDKNEPICLDCEKVVYKILIEENERYSILSIIKHKDKNP